MSTVVPNPMAAAAAAGAGGGVSMTTLPSPTATLSPGEGAPDADEGGAGKPKSALVLAAEKIDPRTAVLTGYLRKQNSAGRWQKRWFSLLGQYWVYAKSHTAPEVLCAMDLWKASPPALQPPAAGEAESVEFSIEWDRFRLFRAASHAEAVRWVNAIAQVQAAKPAATVDRDRLLAGPPTPLLRGKGGVSDTGAGDGKPGVEDWVDGKRPGGGGAPVRSGKGGINSSGGGGDNGGDGGDGDGGAGSGGGVCSSCAVQ